MFFASPSARHPPPANAGVFSAAATSPNQTARQRLEVHITNPTCAGCYSLMDPLGYAFENFGPDALPRTTDNGSLIDTSGKFRGQLFTGAHDLADILAQSTSVDACVAKTLFTYALGVVPSSSDTDTLNHFVTAYN